MLRMRLPKISKLSAYGRADSHLVTKTTHGALGAAGGHDAPDTLMGEVQLLGLTCLACSDALWGAPVRRPVRL